MPSSLDERELDVAVDDDAREEAELAADGERFERLSQDEQRVETLAAIDHTGLTPEVAQYAKALLADLWRQEDEQPADDEPTADLAERMRDALERAERRDREIFESPELQQELIAPYALAPLADPTRRQHPRARGPRSRRMRTARQARAGPDEPSEAPPLGKSPPESGRLGVRGRR